MQNVKLFQANFSTIILRFYLMIAVIAVGAVTGLWGIALLGLPVFLSAMLGIAIKPNKVVEITVTNAKLIPFNMKKKKAV